MSNLFPSVKSFNLHFRGNYIRNDQQLQVAIRDAEVSKAKAVEVSVESQGRSAAPSSNYNSFAPNYGTTNAPAPTNYANPAPSHDRSATRANYNSVGNPGNKDARGSKETLPEGGEILISFKVAADRNARSEKATVQPNQTAV